MKKKFFALLLTLCLALAISAPAFAADSNALQTVRALGIIQGNENGALMLDSYVTRAEFVTMMSRASSYKDSISSDGSGYSLFKDVKSSHWASEYIRLAIQESWVTGYVDGTFRPDQTITLEEACTAVLRMIGYDSSTLAGSFPYAQLNKASSLGLRDEISLKQGGKMTRNDCVQLFYNLLTAKTAQGQVYATTLGYTLTNGEVDYTSVLRDNLSGPYIAESGTKLPFTPTTVYRDGKIASSTALSQYDVYYYNESLKTVWIYTERISGKITALNPNSTSPTSVTISGKTYEIGSTTAAYQLSALGGGSTGVTVTLLLGMDDAVVGVATGNAVDSVYYGVVQSVSKASTTKGDATVETSVTMICTDGTTRTFSVEKDASYTVGRLISVTVANGNVSISSLTEKTLTGDVNAAATKLGKYTFASGVQILDTTEEGDGVNIEPERLAGCNLTSGNVRYYTLNSNNEIDNLILKNVTGDTWTYAYMTSIDDNSTSNNINVTYEYVMDGKTTTLRSTSTKYSISTGGFGISYESDGSIKSMKQMSSVKLTSLGSQTALASNKKYTLSDDVQVYLKKDKEYYLTKLSAINVDDYTLTGWYDTASGSAGGQIRIIIAVAK